MSKIKAKLMLTDKGKEEIMCSTGAGSKEENRSVDNIDG